MFQYDQYTNQIRWCIWCFSMAYTGCNFLFVNWWWIVLPDIILSIAKQQIYMAYLRLVLQDNKFHLMKINSFIDLGCDSLISWSPNTNVHGTNRGPTWVLADPAWPHVGPMNPAIRDLFADGICRRKYWLVINDHMALLGDILELDQHRFRSWFVDRQY